MTNTQIIQCAIDELEKRRWGITEQFFAIHDIVYEDDKPKIEWVDRDKQDGNAIVYFPVRNEKFYFAIYLETMPEIRVTGVDTKSNNCVYFKAYSEVFDFDQLSSMTLLKPTGGWKKGDMPKWGHRLQKYNLVKFEPNPEPDEFENKLRKLLDFLEQDKEGIRSLADTANGFIQAAIIFHNGNTMLGGPYVDKESLQRLGALNLAIGFDLYADGNKWKD